MELTDGLLTALLLALPVVGLVNGPIYAPAVFGVGVLRLLASAARDRAAPALDRQFWLLALMFIVLCWAGIGWSVAPGRTLAGALQASLVLPAALIFLASLRRFPLPSIERLLGSLAAAFLVGTLILLSDKIDGYRLLHLVDGKSAWPTKYNRGIDYFLLMLLPTLGFAVARGRRRIAALLVLAALLTVVAGVNATAQLALPLAVFFAWLGYAAPRAALWLLGAGTAAMALLLPLILRLVTRFRPEITPHIKISGVERLEIWDYISAHVLQRPIAGWGLWTSRLLPASPEEMAHFIKATGSGIYPHNQWLELWVETGLPGVLIGLGFSLLVLQRAAKLSAALRPFALAAYGVAMAVASLGFEITTDSWWASLSVSAGLFTLFDRALSPAESRISPVATTLVPPPPPDTIPPPAESFERRRNRPGMRQRAPGGR
jgi:exopolysaccharide production protein ExoQ